MSTQKWADIEILLRTISRRLSDEQNGRADDVDAGVYDALVEALGFDDGIEVCILWWCPNTRQTGFWCYLHDKRRSRWHPKPSWKDAFREARIQAGTWEVNK